MRWPLPVLVITIAVLAAGCGGDDVDLAAVIDDVEARSGAPEEGDASEPTEAEPTELDTGSDDNGSDDNGSEPDSATKTALEAEAKSGSETLADFFEGGVSGSSEECMTEGLLADADLLEAVIAVQPDGELSDLAERDQIAAIDLGLSCVTAEELSASIQADFDADVASRALAGDAADCLSRRLTDDNDPDRSQLLLALVAIDDGAPTTPVQRDLIIGLMADCISPTFLIDAALQSVVDDPLVGAALDRLCLDAAVQEPGYMEGFWRLFVENSDAEFEEMPLAQQRTVIGPFFDCISFGAVMAAAAAEEGIALSSETTACIDDAIDSSSLIDLFTSGAVFDETALIAAVLPCLSPEELASLG